MQFILLSTRLRRWYPLQRLQMARPRYRDALTASFRAMAPSLVGFHGLAFLCGGMTAWALRAAIASRHFRVVTGGLETVRWTVSAGNGRSPKGPSSGHGSDVLIGGI